MFDRLVLAIDGSDSARLALGLATELAHRFDSQVTVIHVREVAESRGVASEETTQQATNLVDRTVDGLLADGIKAEGTTHVAPLGTAARVIVETAEALPADAIVVGSRGLSDWSAIVLGSVAHKVIGLAHCPVVVAR